MNWKKTFTLFLLFRSKNLDILFKREYYEQKLSIQSKPVRDFETRQNIEEEAKQSQQCDKEEGECSGEKMKGSFDTIDPSQIEEFQPMEKKSMDTSEHLAER